MYNALETKFQSQWSVSRGKGSQPRNLGGKKEEREREMDGEIERRRRKRRGRGESDGGGHGRD